MRDQFGAESVPAGEGVPVQQAQPVAQPVAQPAPAAQPAAQPAAKPAAKAEAKPAAKAEEKPKVPQEDPDIKKLVDFIQKNKHAGFKPKIIQDALIKQGWPVDKVQKAFQKAQ